MKFDLLEVVLVGLIVVLVLCIAAAFISEHKEAVRYKQVCMDSGGAPVWNGGYRECIKKGEAK